MLMVPRGKCVLHKVKKAICHCPGRKQVPQQSYMVMFIAYMSFSTWPMTLSQGWLDGPFWVLSLSECVLHVMAYHHYQFQKLEFLIETSRWHHTRHTQHQFAKSEFASIHKHWPRSQKPSWNVCLGQNCVTTYAASADI